MTDDFKDTIRGRAGLNGTTLYRVGTPSIGETFGMRFNRARDTGGLGTGVYAFTTREAADQNVERTSPDREVFELYNAVENPVSPSTFQATVKLNDMSVEAVRLIHRVRSGDTTYDEARESPPRRMDRKAFGVLLNTPQFRPEFGLDDDRFVRAWIDACESADNAQDSRDSRTATQPINHLLWPEFDGVTPRGEAGESGTYGAVILKERVDGCAGYETSFGEQIEASVLNECFSHND